jgi:hypothetical protein
MDGPNLDLLGGRRGPEALDFAKDFRILMDLVLGQRNRYKVPVEEIDYLDVGERTRSQPGGSASTVAGF